MKLEPIDLNNLDTILKTHAYEFQDATEELPALRNAMTAAKIEIERLEASLSIQHRADFEAKGEKATEAKITAAVKADPSLADANAKHLAARQAFDEVDLLRAVFMQREASIKNLVSLYHAQYWSLGSIDVIPKAVPVTSVAPAVTDTATLAAKAEAASKAATAKAATVAAEAAKAKALKDSAETEVEKTTDSGIKITYPSTPKDEVAVKPAPAAVAPAGTQAVTPAVTPAGAPAPVVAPTPAVKPAVAVTPALAPVTSPAGAPARPTFKSRV